ncbi:hypothetical protein [Sphingomonas nostoxanthinifaciens]|uniref:hypothetical protein n=1 Tax=Sphingomonas nostoxanthinifaciens TaxID=2872652 RepID=UPI001CC1DEB3|nr:hypothetical protein [Sphingomonas nostoxanthinifaciens]UAK23212.1 hypothetical protein K8P63_12420 [Sphingomonas nostoxanthinifaciens]
MSDPEKPWDGAAVRTWLESRIAAARADQVAAERYGRERQDDCDKAAAEELVCTAVRNERVTAQQDMLVQELKGLLDRDDYVWRGVYNDDRFDRHVRTYIRKLMKSAKANEGFANIKRYQ